ncbi:MAG: serine/threonine-protein kinase [Byssovorax sp.]
MAERADLLTGSTAIIAGRAEELAGAREADALPAGTRVGAYVLEDLRFQGGFAVVYRAARADGGGLAAIKVLRRALITSPGMRARFEQEAAAIARIQHPHLVQIFDTGVTDSGQPFIAMEWLDGRNLLEEIARRGPFAAVEALEILDAVGGALTAAHALGIVHRDVKAQNIMAVPRDHGITVKLVDFGIAKLLDLEADPRGGMVSSVVLGTPLTMAPEQILGRPVDQRVDIYALGLLLHQLVTGQLPFRGATRVEIEAQHLHTPPPRTSDLAPVGSAFDAVVRRCIEKDAAHRYPSVSELLVDLRHAVGAAPRSPQVTQVIGVHCEARVNAASDDLDEHAFADIEQILALTRRTFAESGLAILAESATAVVGAATLGPGIAPRERILDAALDLGARLDARPGAHAEVTAVLSLHVGTMAAIRAWTADLDGGRVLATSATVEGVSDRFEVHPTPGRPDLFTCTGRRSTH